MGTIAIISVIAATFLFIACAVTYSWDSDLISVISGCLGAAATLLAIILGISFGVYKSDANATVSNAGKSLHQQGYDVQRIYANGGVWYAQVSLQQQSSCNGTITFVPDSGAYIFTATIVNDLPCAHAAANSTAANSDDSNGLG